MSKSFTKSNPCPICKQAKQCLLQDDGTVFCYYESAGCRATRTDCNEDSYYIHEQGAESGLRDGAPSENRFSKKSPPPIGCIEARHAAYSAMLSACPLSPEHKANLISRGLTEQQIAEARYATMPREKPWNVAKKMSDATGVLGYDGVPGLFMAHNEKTNDDYLNLNGRPGIIIPARDVQHHIQGAQVRADDADLDESRDNKYTWLSSRSKGGCSPGSPPHVPVWVFGPFDTARLIEGFLKADISVALSGFPAAGIAGVGHWRGAIATLRAMGVNTVRVAFDMDAATNPKVAKALLAAAKGLAEEEFIVELEQWDPQYKGIDDLLLAGGTTEIIPADQVVATCERILEAALAFKAAELAAKQAEGETPPGEAVNVEPEDNGDAQPAAEISAGGLIADLQELFDAGGLQAVFEDADLRKRLATVAVSDPAVWAIVLNCVKQRKVNGREFQAGLVPDIAQAKKEKPTTTIETADGGYFIQSNCLCRVLNTDRGEVIIPIANFSSLIHSETTLDDGVDQLTIFRIETTLSTGESRGCQDIRASAFAEGKWPHEKFGASCIVWQGEKFHFIPGTQAVSIKAGIKRIVKYTHLGWREINGKWVYLHGAGAVGLPSDQAVEIELQPPLDRYKLPPVPEGEELVQAVRSVLRLLELGPPEIMFPIVAAVFRAVLGECDFSIFFVGHTGSFKSELAALAQQFFGREMNARHLPGNWSSTANALEGLAFLAASALFVVDDFVPNGPNSAKQHADADRLLRAAGNASGRQRMRHDTTMRPAKPPRGLIFSTGEDIPAGHSLRARMFIIESMPGGVSSQKLTECQIDASTGHYERAMAGFLRYIADGQGGYQRAVALRRDLAERIRNEQNTPDQHARTPANAAELCAGFAFFLKFAMVTGAIAEEERQILNTRAKAAIFSDSAGQAEHLEDGNTAYKFLSLLRSVISSGRGHFADENGGPPPTPQAYGWRFVTSGRGSFAITDWARQGTMLGWMKGEDLFLEPGASFAEVMKLANDQRATFATSQGVVWKRMKDFKLLVPGEGRHLKTKVFLQGQQMRLVRVPTSAFNGANLWETDPRQKVGKSDSQSEPVERDADGNSLFSPTDGEFPTFCGKEGESGTESGKRENTVNYVSDEDDFPHFPHFPQEKNRGLARETALHGGEEAKTECEFSSSENRPISCKKVGNVGFVGISLDSAQISEARCPAELIQHANNSCPHMGLNTGPHWLPVDGDARCLDCLPPTDAAEVYLLVHPATETATAKDAS